MDKKNNKRVFTLTEVTIAIAVIAVGMIGILALFPVGFQAANDAVGDDYSSAMAEQFLHFIKMNCLEYDGNGEYTTIDSDKIVPFESGSDINGNGIQDWDGWGEWITNTRAPFYNDSNILQIPTNSPQKDNLDIGKVLSSAKAKEIGVLGKSYLMGDKDGDGWDDAGIYFDKDLVGVNNGVFYVESRSKDIIDWDGVMYVWQERLQYDSNGNKIADADMPDTFSAKLCVEISWPFNKPYEKRKKRVYVLEIFNPINR